jgi:dihydroorotate dehydrogenase
MLGAVIDFARPLLHFLSPEQANEVVLRLLELGIYPRSSTSDDFRLGQNVWGLDFPNPLAIAAGFDKDARVPDAIHRMGFGYAEVGTITPRAQPGNEGPRVFRLQNDRAIINRMGFNSAGQAAALARLLKRRSSGIVGINIGANKGSPDPVVDYVAGISCFYDVASYFTVNISSPNTPGLRDLQAPASLDNLLARVLDTREKFVAAGRPRRPVVVKLAPDIAEADLEPIVRVLTHRGADGIAVSNTTLARTDLRDAALAKEAGGLSGRPLFHRSTVMLARVYVLTGGRIPLIGIGGIDSAAAAIAKVEAGASLLQLYTGLVYEGPGLVTRIKQDLVAHLQREKLARVGEATGRGAEAWASASL